VNIFEFDYLFIPWNDNNHWFAAVVCFPNEVGSYLLFLNSLHRSADQYHAEANEINALLKKVSEKPTAIV